MEKETLILKRAADSASLRMPMDNNGKDPARIYKLSHSIRLKKLMDSSF